MAMTVLRDELFFLGAFFATIIMGKNTVSYKTVPRMDTNTETGGCMYSEGLLMMSA
jgi:hypothetical protein